METFALYLFRSAIWLTGFTLVYFLFLRHERFFLLKRYYLVTGILVSFICPLISLHYQVELPAPDIYQDDILPAGNGLTVAVQNSNSGKSADLRLILMGLYIAGILFFALNLLIHLRSLVKSIKKSEIANYGRFKLIKSPEFSSSFSFFSYVFINPSVTRDEEEEIMNHELVHVNQRHWFDLLLAEFLRLLQWANPFVWIYTGFIRLNHEYLADETALQRTSDPAVYKAVLMNQLFDTKVFSLSNSFNYSLNKNRFEMMKKIIASPYRKLKVLYVLPVIAVILYAFATPEYIYPEVSGTPVTIYQAPAILQKVVKGIVVDEVGKPLGNVNITSTGPVGFASGVETAADGHFTISNLHENSSLLFSLRGYKGQSLKPDFTSEMKVVMVKDPGYKGPSGQSPRPKPLYVVDGVLSEVNPPADEVGIVKMLPEKDAIARYGEKGKAGVIEITTVKRAAELGIKIPFRRRNPEDYPTFRGEKFTSFRNWVLSQLKYPAEAQAKKIEGWVQVNFVVEPDGSVSNIKPGGSGDYLLISELTKVIGSSPKWEPAKNPDAKEPFQSSVTVKFSLPDRIVSDDPFVVVEKMPMYPGGDQELLNFIALNTHYPDEAKRDTIQGKVIVRFVVNTEGNAEGASVLKGAHPLLDAEALRVISMLKGFSPGTQDGKPVSVWYMVPVSFTLK